MHIISAFLSNRSIFSAVVGNIYLFSELRKHILRQKYIYRRQNSWRGEYVKPSKANFF